MCVFCTAIPATLALGAGYTIKYRREKLEARHVDDDLHWLETIDMIESQQSVESLLKPQAYW